MSDTLTLLQQAMQGLDAAGKLQLISTAAAALAIESRPAILDQELAPVVKDRATWPLAIPQWQTADGLVRGVVIRALSYDDIEYAEKQALTRNKTGEWVINEYTRTLYEVARGIVEPAGMTPAIIRRWNYAVIESIHAAVRNIATLPAAIAEAELARLAGGPTPPRSAAVDAGVAEPLSDDLGSDDSTTDGSAGPA